MCNCASYNWRTGQDKEVVLILPNWCDTTRKNRDIFIDFCIADVIKNLWKNNIETLDCCCGHKKINPSVIIGQDINIDEVFNLIWQIDKRTWTVSRWERIDYTLEYKQGLAISSNFAEKLVQKMMDTHDAINN